MYKIVKEPFSIVVMKLMNRLQKLRERVQSGAALILLDPERQRGGIPHVLSEVDPIYRSQQRDQNILNTSNVQLNSQTPEVPKNSSNKSPG